MAGEGAGSSLVDEPHHALPVEGGGDGPAEGRLPEPGYTRTQWLEVRFTMEGIDEQEMEISQRSLRKEKMIDGLMAPFFRLKRMDLKKLELSYGRTGNSQERD